MQRNRIPWMNWINGIDPGILYWHIYNLICTITYETYFGKQSNWFVGTRLRWFENSILSRYNNPQWRQQRRCDGISKRTVWYHQWYPVWTGYHRGPRGSRNPGHYLDTNFFLKLWCTCIDGRVIFWKLGNQKCRIYTINRLNSLIFSNSTWILLPWSPSRLTLTSLGVQILHWPIIRLSWSSTGSSQGRTLNWPDVTGPAVCHTMYRYHIHDIYIFSLQ